MNIFGDKPSGRDKLLNKLSSRVLTLVGITHGYASTGGEEFCLGESTPLVGMSDSILRRGGHSLGKLDPILQKLSCWLHTDPS